MSEKYKIYPGGLFFTTMTVVGWIDVFSRNIYSDELINSLNYCIDKKELRVYCFCIMMNHMHMIASRETGLLGDVLRDMKCYTAKRIIKMIETGNYESRKEWMLDMFRHFGNKNKHNSEFQFWQQKNHAFDLFTNKMIEEKVNYIHNNPVKAGYVNAPENYIYTSANPFTELKLSPL